MTEILRLKSPIESAADAIRRGEIGIFPAKNAYMLIGLVEQTKRIRQIKQKPNRKPLVCMMESLEQFSREVDTSRIDDATLNMLRYLSMLDVIVPLETPTYQNYRDPEFSGGGFYFPNKLTYAHDLIRAVGQPIIASSANTSGVPTSFQISDIPKAVLENSSFVYDVGTIPFRPDFTIFEPNKNIFLRMGDERIVQMCQLIHSNIKNT